MELNPVDTDTKFKMDEIVTFKGILNLNYDDIYRSNYILDKAGLSMIKLIARDYWSFNLF